MVNFPLKTDMKKMFVLRNVGNEEENWKCMLFSFIDIILYWRSVEGGGWWMWGLDEIRMVSSVRQAPLIPYILFLKPGNHQSWKILEERIKKQFYLFVIVSIHWIFADVCVPFGFSFNVVYMCFCVALK